MPRPYRPWGAGGRDNSRGRPQDAQSVRLNESTFAREMGFRSKLHRLLVLCSPSQGPTGTRLVMELIEELALRVGATPIRGLAAGEHGAPSWVGALIESRTRLYSIFLSPSGLALAVLVVLLVLNRDRSRSFESRRKGRPGGLAVGDTLSPFTFATGRGRRSGSLNDGRRRLLPCSLRLPALSRPPAHRRDGA